MEFGEAITTDGDHKHGQWHLWLYMCHWRIETAGRAIAGSDDDRNELQSSIARIQWGTVIEIQRQGLSQDLVVTFASGARLLTFSSSSRADCQQLMLFTPDGHSSTLFGDGHVVTEPATMANPSSEAL
jgi:hypothetical protein